MNRRRVLVVGASAGIGRGIASRLVALGARVVFSGRREGALRSAVETAGGGETVVADLAVPSECAALVERTVSLLGGLDVLIIAASSSRLTMLRDTDADEYHRLLSANLVGPNLVIAAASEHLSPGSVVGLLSSESVGDPLAGLAVYATTKAALDELARGWRAEYPELRFTTITVGSTGGTDFTRDFDMELAARLLPQWIAAGQIKARSMEADDLGAAIADMIAVAVNHPGLECQQITLRPPGPFYSGDVGRAMSNVKTADT